MKYLLLYLHFDIENDILMAAYSNIDFIDDSKVFFLLFYIL